MTDDGTIWTGQVSEFDVNLEQQSVFVKGSIGFEALTEKISKTGKQVRTAYAEIFLIVHLEIYDLHLCI